jgi:hypothetical protein
MELEMLRGFPREGTLMEIKTRSPLPETSHMSDRSTVCDRSTLREGSLCEQGGFARAVASRERSAL